MGGVPPQRKRPQRPAPVLGRAKPLIRLGPAMEALWATLGQASFDADTTSILTAQAENFDGTVAELATRGDEAQIRVMGTLGGIGAGGPPRRSGQVVAERDPDADHEAGDQDPRPP